MAGVASNEPYHRVSQDNGVYDGAMIGAAVAAGGAGAGIFGARLNYNGIPNKVQKQVSQLDSRLDTFARQEEKLNERHDKKINKILDKERVAGARYSPRQAYQYNQKHVDKALDRLETSHQKNKQKIRTRADNVIDQMGQMDTPGYLAERQSKHMYSKMGGAWKKAGIVGASAIVGAGIGAAIDGIMD